MIEKDHAGPALFSGENAQRQWNEDTRELLSLLRSVKEAWNLVHFETLDIHLRRHGHHPRIFLNNWDRIATAAKGARKPLAWLAGVGRQLRQF